jgi:sarcosine oxidase subunit alpha
MRTAAGGRIDRTRPLRFTFDGASYEGLAGDTLASALLANGVHLVGRSFKYHRPRGIVAAGAEEPNALVTVQRDAARSTPNLRATQVELYDGLEAHSQNRWPNLQSDVGRVNDWLSPFFPAGFYYKTFMWPRTAWKSLYEPFIRRAAGLGIAPTRPDPDRYAQRYAHCDVLVVGGGPAGLAAALAAADSGARVMLCDESAEFGGSLLGDDSARIDGRSGLDWVRHALAALGASGRVTLLPRTTAFGYFPHNFIGLNERITDHLAAPPAHLPRERLWQVRARRVVLATGAIERPLVFPGNDRPGILLAGAAQTYLNRYGVRVGRRIVIVTADDAAYQAALDLKAAGVAIAAIADLRAQPTGDLPDAARGAGIEIAPSATVLGTEGNLRVTAISLGESSPDGRVRPTRRIECDAVLMSGGFTPSVHLFSQSRGKLAWNEPLKAFVPGASAERERSAGACRGLTDLAEALADGTSAGADAAGAAGAAAPATGAGAAAAGSRASDAATHATASLAPGASSAGSRAAHTTATTVAPTPGAPAPSARRFAVEHAPRAAGAWLGPLPSADPPSGLKSFVDWQHDVTTRDIKLAAREGFQSIEHVKRYTTTGMATDQGKTSNLNALAIVARDLSAAIPQIGLTTFRMPYTPTTFGSFAGISRGDLFDPRRTTPMHAWAQAQGAVFENVGLWKRARYFPRSGEDLHAAVARECLAVRGACGIFDASTLGKIEVVGADAAEFMNRLYVNNWSGLAAGRARYGILCREDGFIYDDGVVARLAADRFHVTTTTGGAPRVLALMEDYRQTEWPDLEVWLTSTTEQWAVIAVQGPNARRVLEPLVTGIDLSAAALPHMAIGRGKICGVPLLLFRVSFTGELGFEINVPADFGAAVWEQVHAAGQAHGMVPYGTETMHVLRAEKGYIIVGQDTDGTVTPDDAGLSWAIGKNKTDFVGKRSLERASMRAPDRKQLVGLRVRTPGAVLEEGAQVADKAGQKPPMQLIGHVTSSYASSVLGYPIALALIAGGRARLGQTLYVPMPGGDLEVEVTSPIFYDPKGARING